MGYDTYVGLRLRHSLRAVKTIREMRRQIFFIFRKSILSTPLNTFFFSISRLAIINQCPSRQSFILLPPAITSSSERESKVRTCDSSRQCVPGGYQTSREESVGGPLILSFSLERETDEENNNNNSFVCWFRVETGFGLGLDCTYIPYLSTTYLF